MRRRLFWTLAGVSAITGFLVLVGATFASQRAAVEATRRELVQSSAEVVAIIDEAVAASPRRPGALLELFRLVEGDLGPTLARIRRAAGSSELAFAAVLPEGPPRAENPLFSRIDVAIENLPIGVSTLVTSTSRELVVLTPTIVGVGDTEVVLVVALARATPVVRLADVAPGLIVVAVGLLLLSAALARILSNSVVARLNPLAAASRQLAQGDLAARVPDLQDPDLDGLGHSFNEMAGQIEATRDREREFLLGVGHDLRTPLTTIAGYAEALESGATDPGDVSRIGEILGVQSRQLGRLIEDLTLLARLEQPEFTFRVEPVDVGAHLSEVVDGFRRRAEEAGVNLVAEIEDGAMASTDPDRLAQIVQNLLENALRFTPETGTVTVAVASDGDEVDVSVSDTGVGIEPDDLQRVFDRHYVGRHRRLRNEGSGLGLSIVKGLADRLGGQVSVTSRPGKGTSIHVRLPSHPTVS